MTEGTVRGAGRPRAGATDTTMLIWKVIDANPGISREEIWERVEHSVPEGYALRVYARDYPASQKRSADGSGDLLRSARRRVLSMTLTHMRHHGVVAWEDRGANCRYTALREPRYFGNPDAIDETGTKAAEHMAVADALRRMEKMAARAKLDPQHARTGRCITGGLKDYDALVLLVKALRAKPAP